MYFSQMNYDDFSYPCAFIKCQAAFSKRESINGQPHPFPLKRLLLSQYPDADYYSSSLGFNLVKPVTKCQLPIPCILVRTRR